MTMAARSLSITNTTGTTTGTVEDAAEGRLGKVVLSWTSHTDGAVLCTTDTIAGTIARVTFNPGATAPDDNYDVTLADADGFDVLAGLGANRHTTTTQSLVPFIGNGTVTDREMMVQGPLTLTIAAAGSAKIGTITLYLRR
jgi:hypothetical protein